MTSLYCDVLKADRIDTTRNSLNQPSQPAVVTSVMEMAIIRFNVDLSAIHNDLRTIRLHDKRTSGKRL